MKKQPLTVHHSRIEDVRLLANRLRRDDPLEIRYLYGKKPSEVLMSPFLKETPKEIYSILSGKRLLGIIGCMSSKIEQIYRFSRSTSIARSTVLSIDNW